MRRTLLLLAMAVIGVASLAAKNVKGSTTYIIDGTKVENFDGSQLVGKTVANYYVDQEKNVHVIITVEHAGGKQVKNVSVVQTRSSVGTNGESNVEPTEFIGYFNPGETAFVMDGQLIDSFKFVGQPTSVVKTMKIVKDTANPDFIKYAAEAKKATGVEPKCIIFVTSK